MNSVIVRVVNFCLAHESYLLPYAAIMFPYIGKTVLNPSSILDSEPSNININIDRSRV